MIARKARPNLAHARGIGNDGAVERQRFVQRAGPGDGGFDASGTRHLSGNRRAAFVGLVFPRVRLARHGSP